MAASRQEEIIDTVKVILDGATAAGNSVFINKGDAIEVEDLPAIVIRQGSIEPINDLATENLGFYDVDMDLFIMIVDAGTVGAPLTVVNDIHAEIHRLLMVDVTLTLPYVISLYPDGATAPEVSQASQAVTELTTNWFVRFRQNYIDIGI